MCDSGYAVAVSSVHMWNALKKCEELMLVEHQFPLYFEIILEFIGTDEIG